MWLKFWFCLLLLHYGVSVSALRVKGKFVTNDFFQFLAKFGFQKTDIHQEKDTYGYIFGNISSSSHFSHYVTLAVLDRKHFLEYYKNRNIEDKELACQQMFHYLNNTAYNPKCNPHGIDLLRRVPCPINGLCIDEDAPENVVKNNQFTYMIRNNGQPRYWYISMVACYLNETTCTWHYYDNSMNKQQSVLNYDVWFVNGSPNYTNILKYQFSFDRQNTLEMYLLFWFCYVILLPVQIFAVRTQKHPVTRLFTVSLILEFIALNFIVLHNVRFAFDGVGFTQLDVTGDIFDILGRTLFMLLLLLLAKGWAVTRIELTWKPLVFSVWLCYGVVHVLLYIWNKTEVDIIEEIDEYQTWPGWLILGLRLCIMAWFVLELRMTMRYEHNIHKLHFLLHFGASSLVWWVYLPIIALVALEVSPLWRYKFLLGITYSADCLAYCIMAHLLWPTRSEQYLLLTSNTITGIEELDEMNESPHVVHSDTVSLTSDNLMNDEDEVLFTRQPRNSVPRLFD